MPSVAIFAVCLVVTGTMYALSQMYDEQRYLPQYRAPTSSETIVYAQMAYALESDEANDILFIGDSGCLTGVVTPMIEARTGARAYNLGTLGSLGPDVHVAILEAYLQHHPPPQTLVYAVQPYVIRQKGSYMPDLREQFLRSYGQGLSGIDRVSPLSAEDRVREGLRTLIGRYQGGAERYFHQVRKGGAPSHVEMVAMIREQRGFFEDRQRLPFRLGGGEVLRVSSWFQTHLDRLAVMTRERGIRLVVHMIPEPRPATTTETRPLIKWLDAFEARHSHVRVGRPQVLFYDRDRFATRWHLNRQGGEAFTEVILETLQHDGGISELVGAPESSDKVAAQIR
jgi:hypothetical protein